MLLNRYRGLESRHDRPSVVLQAGGTSSSGAGLARDVRAIPIKIITVSKGNSPGANLMAEEWMEKVWERGLAGGLQGRAWSAGWQCAAIMCVSCDQQWCWDLIQGSQCMLTVAQIRWGGGHTLACRLVLYYLYFRLVPVPAPVLPCRNRTCRSRGTHRL